MIPSRSSTGASRSRAAEPTTGRSAIGTRLEDSAPTATPPASKQACSPPRSGRANGSAGRTNCARSSSLKARPSRARAYVSGLGYYELRINGRKVGDHVLDPGWTTYGRRVLYATYDVTDYLQQGANVVAVVLGQGWYESRAFVLQLNIDSQGEKRVEMVTDTSWKTGPGPIVSDSVYGGETYDARLETTGWDRPGFKDAAWKAASAVDPPKGEMSAQMMPPIRVVDTITPLKMTTPRPGVYVFDMGQNFSGWVRLRVQGPKGTTVRLRHAELLYEDGMLNTENLRKANATDVYILRGDRQEEVYEPRFTYHGFRYVELTGYPGVPAPGAVRRQSGPHRRAPTGGFSSSNPILNQIQRMVYWSVRFEPAQHPHRLQPARRAHGLAGGRAPGGRVGHLELRHGRFLHELPTRHPRHAVVRRHADRHRAIQGWRRPADPAWGSAYPLLAWYMYVYYGDSRILEQHYEGMKAWADYLHSRAKDGVVSYYSYADWVSVAKTPGDLVSTAFYCWSVDIVTRAAMILGKTDDAVTYQKLGASIREAFPPRVLQSVHGHLRRRLPDRDRTPPVPRHGARGPPGGGAFRPYGRYRLREQHAPDDRNRRHQVLAAALDPVRPLRPGLRSGDSDHLSELGLHGGERRDHRCGSCGRTEPARR